MDVSKILAELKAELPEGAILSLERRVRPGRPPDVSKILAEINTGSGNGSDPTFCNHFCWWLGDLNYRTHQIEREDLMKLIAQKDWTTIQNNYEQLYTEMAMDRVFPGWAEAPINFPPTYRYERGCREWSKKKLKNMPSWCDRVLYRAYPGMFIESTGYDHCPELTTSDHSPIKATFRILCRLPSLTLIFPPIPETPISILVDVQVTFLDAYRDSAALMVRCGGPWLGQASVTHWSDQYSWAGEHGILINPPWSHWNILQHQFLVFDVLALGQEMLGYMQRGQGLLPLAPAVFSTDQAFDINLEQNGHIVGSLKAKVAFPPRAVDSKSKKS